MSAADVMTHRCSIERPARVSDGGGGFTTTFLPVAADVPCRCWFEVGNTGAIADVAGQPNPSADHSIIVPVGTDVQVGDRVPQVEDQAAVVLFPGPFEVEAVARRLDHWQLYARQVD